MQARGFTYLGQIPRTQLLEVVAKGLQLLAENTASLMEDAQACHQAGRPRGAAVLASYATEEAAKAMMLLDLARDGWQDLSLLRSMGQHLARLIYVWTYVESPANLEEVHRDIDELRRDQVFLDDDIPIVGRNRMLQDREELLYVDYVLTYQEERALKDASNGTGPPVAAVLGQWVSPKSVWLSDARREELLVPPIVALLPMLERAGCLTPEGLTVIADTWRSDGGTFKEGPHYRNLEQLNHTVLQALERAGQLRDDFGGDDVRGIVQGWSFPLTGVTLRPKEVTDEEINHVFERWAIAEGFIDPDDV